MKNVGFDEKIDGTIHLALGNSYSFTGGLNESTIHWDIVKDLRSSGRITVDGRVVQHDGAWSL
jgi:aminopeptidase